jgi:hypothetical protein
MSNATIDTQKPVIFFDDRGKAGCSYHLTAILFEDDKLVLGQTQPLRFERGGQVKDTREEAAVILFNKITGEVLSTEFEFWVAENEKNPKISVASRP